MAKKIRWTSLILVAILLFACLGGLYPKASNFALASQGNVDYEKNINEYFSFIPYEDGYYISEYKGDSKILEIPEFYNGKKVTGIKDAIKYDLEGGIIYGTDGNPISTTGVFEGKNIEKISFGNNLSYIGSRAFANCKKIVEISMPENVKRVHHQAFNGCTNLTNVDLSKLEYVGNEILGGTAWQNAIIEQNMEIADLKDVTDEDVFYDNEIYYEEVDNIMLLKVYNYDDDDSVDDGAEELIHYKVKENTRLIASQPFRFRLPINEISIPNTVKYIGSTALGPKDRSKEEINLDWDFCKINVYKTQGNKESNITNTAELAQYFKELTLEEYSLGEVGDLVDSNWAVSFYGKLTAIRNENAKASGILDLSSSNVTTITKRVAEANTKIKMLILPSTLEYIGVEAFRGCTNLQEIVFTGGNVKLDNGCFKDCKNLTTIRGLECVSEIGDYAFKNCTNLNDIKLGNTQILTNAFNGCSNLLDISVENDKQIQGVGEKAFVDTAKIKDDNQVFITVGDYLIKYIGSSISITISNANGIEHIADYALSSNSKLQSVVIGEGVEIGKDVFYNCGGLQNVTLNNNDVGDRAFYNCGSLENLSGKATSIGMLAFANTKINKLDLSSADNIGNFAFYNTKIEELDIKGASLQEYALFGLKELKVIQEDSQDYKVENNVLYNQDGTIVLCCPAKTTATQIELNNVIIGKGAFAYCSTLPTIIGSATEIKDCAFYESKVVFNVNGVEKLGYKSFYGSKIDTLVFDSLKEVKDKALCYSNVKTLNLTCETELPYGVLKATENLTDLTISLNIKQGSQHNAQLGYLFGKDYYDKAEQIIQKYNSNYNNVYYVPKIEKLTITSGEIGYGGVMEFKYLTDLTIGDKVTSLGLYAFSNCTSLQNVTIANTIKDIPAYCFNGCKNLKSFNSSENVVDLNGIKFVGAFAFGDCNSIEKVNITQSLTASNVYGGAFVNCANLKNINISSNEFFNVDNKKTIYGNLFDSAINVIVGDKTLSQEEITSLKNIWQQPVQKGGFKQYVKENKTTIICLAFVLLAVIILVGAPIIIKHKKPSGVDEYGRVTNGRKKHHKHHHAHHHHHKHHHHKND